MRVLLIWTDFETLLMNMYLLFNACLGSLHAYSCRNAAARTRDGECYKCQTSHGVTDGAWPTAECGPDCWATNHSGTFSTTDLIKMNIQDVRRAVLDTNPPGHLPLIVLAGA